MFIVWNEDLATGNEDIDNQHKKLFRRFNDLQVACKQGKGLDELSKLLTYLGEYIRYHLSLEEHLQIINEYPGYLMHKEEHDGFIRNFRKLEDQLKAKGTTSALLIQTNMTIAEWLTRHFTWADKDFAHFLHTSMPSQ